jgi:uncharacterized membrane protein
MRIRTVMAFGALMIVAGPALGGPGSLTAQQHPIVHAVLFYSPTCPHCHKVITEDLPRIFAQFGGPPQLLQGTVGHVVSNGTLDLLLVDVTYPEGLAAFESAGRAVGIPPEENGVPRLVCGTRWLLGDVDIPANFPRLIADGLAQGGIGWPRIAGLDRLFPPGYVAQAKPDTSRRADTAVAAVKADTAVAAVKTDTAVAAAPSPRSRRSAAPPAPRPIDTVASQDTAVAVVPTPPPPRDTSANMAQILTGGRRGPVISQTFQADPVGTLLAIGLILVMLFSLGWMSVKGPSRLTVPDLTVPLLVLVGVGIAAYLAYIEVTGAEAVCGPVGDCNAVQQSVYARIFGIPVALVGLVGYLAILSTWVVSRRSNGAAQPGWVRSAPYTLAVIGTAASLALTILEPFVIGAVCLWCCGSAVVMTALMWTTPEIREPPPSSAG